MRNVSNLFMAKGNVLSEGQAAFPREMRYILWLTAAGPETDRRRQKQGVKFSFGKWPSKENRIDSYKEIAICLRNLLRLQGRRQGTSDESR